MVFSFKTIGCRLNQAETEEIAEKFGNAGYKIADHRSNSDVFIINTCSVTHSADRKTYQAIRAFRNRNPKSFVVAIGCGAKLNEAEADMIVENFQKEKIFEIVLKNGTLRSTGHQTSNRRESSFCGPKNFQRTRKLIKIQDGCDDFCTYCIVPYLRGKPRSIPIKKILQKIGDKVQNGCKEVILTGVNIGTYKDNRTDLHGLTKKILQRTKVQRIRFSSIEPQHFDKKLLIFFKNKRVCEFLHLPIQSGSNKILKLMGRKYKVSDILDLTSIILKKVPDMFLSTDIIVGFPGETEKDFEKTFNLCEKIGFAKIHVFSYSKREGTLASKISECVEPKIVLDRRNRLQALSAKLDFEYRKRFLGRELAVLFEKKNGGLSGNYVRVSVRGKKRLLNQIVPVRIKEVGFKETIGKVN